MFFVGAGKMYNKHVDVEGFANWGKPGSSVDYNGTEPVGGVLIGKKVKITGIPLLRLELDGTFGDISAGTNKVDPKGLDETVEADAVWLFTARAGFEEKLGPVTLFINGGLALAQISNSVTDIDFGPNKPPMKDFDDSFSDDSVHVGWVVGAGAEVPVFGSNSKFLQDDDDNWILRLEGSYINFGESSYEVNHSGNNICGPGGPNRPCPLQYRK